MTKNNDIKLPKDREQSKQTHHLAEIVPRVPDRQLRKPGTADQRVPEKQQRTPAPAFPRVSGQQLQKLGTDDPHVPEEQLPQPSPAVPHVRENGFHDGTSAVDQQGDPESQGKNRHGQGHGHKHGHGHGQGHGHICTYSMYIHLYAHGQVNER